MNNLTTMQALFMQSESGEMIVRPEAIGAIREMDMQVKKQKKEYDKVKKLLLEGMEAYGLKKVDTDELLITYVPPQERIGIDTDKLWKEHKDIAFECQKFTDVKSSVRITVR